MIDLQRSLRHLAWSDAWMMQRLVALPAEAMLAQYSPRSWSVARLAIHTVGGAEWYRYCLTGTPWTDLSPPSTEPQALQQFVGGLAPHLAAIDALLVEQSASADEFVAFVDEDGERQALRSTILSQACLHGAEHRAQIACALEVSGFDGFVLDDIDLWAFEAHERASVDR